MLKGHGDDYLPNHLVKYNFSSNIYSECNNLDLLDYVKENLFKVNSYPSPDYEEYNVKLKNYFKSNKEFFITSGATEAFYLLAELYQNSKTLIFIPSFSEYEDSCKRYNHKIKYVSNTDYKSIDFGQFDLVFICNPNNPDGFTYDSYYLSEQFLIHKKSIFIIDEAYIEYSRDINLFNTDNLENVILVRSLTKRWSIPGLRLGYIIISREIKEKLQKLLMPWRISQPAISALEFLIDNNQLSSEICSNFFLEADNLKKEISQLDEFEVIYSETPYFLLKSLRLKSDFIKTILLEKFYILVRDASNFRGLDNRYIRICSNPKCNDKLIEGFKWISSNY
ncbi:MAG: histidinol-phosphate aminotransferase family protein [Candidatus Delongbacteria bacterium]|nr:histidinol-phosphate aminotransferase family protein [Candidatus Delongbacteria bacterium]MBN2835037.1 histidinol-phosphate aminotransferase family protein [Candidatus Delongbacteria bacterium]